MVVCYHCAKDCPSQRDSTTGYICCVECGRVVDQDVFTEEPTFVKGPGGESRLSGCLLQSIEDDLDGKHIRAVKTGDKHIDVLAQQLDIRDQNATIEASEFYKIAVERSFTKGRKTEQVAAACLYIACRLRKKPVLLIDFSICLLINVYELGAVFLQVCRLLSLHEHPVVLKPVDPTIFIDMFTSRLMGYNNFKVSKTALSIIASMKRDWMQTGRKPSGLCGAAVYISALSHGYKYSKSEVVKVVHICEATMTKRLIEFENTESGGLTIEDFNKYAKKFEEEKNSRELSDVNCQKSGTMEIICEHKDQKLHFAHGLCRDCYADFIEISGGINSGSEPPAFQRAERERLAKASAEVVKESSSVVKPNQDKNSSENEVAPCAKANQNVNDNGRANLAESLFTSAQVKINGASSTFQEFEDMSNVADETDGLSDIDDVEVNSYLNNEEETRYKKMIWEEMNKEYLQEQAAKEAAAAAAYTDFNMDPDDMRSAKELAAAAAAAVAKSREKRRNKQSLEAKNAGPAQTAAEATHQMLTKKRLSSKINYDALEKLFADEPAPDAKRNRVDSPLDSNVTEQQLEDKENEADDSTNNGDHEQYEEDMEETVAKKAHPHEWYFENGEVYEYDYDNGDDFDEF